MASKSDKCCCGCEGSCINIGSLFPLCIGCDEWPLDFAISAFRGGTQPLFTCCSPGFPSAGHILIGDVTACIWTSVGIGDCHFTLTFVGAAVGQAVLRLINHGIEVAQWINLKDWNCLCPNLMTHNPGADAVYDTPDGDECHLPNEVCVIPQPACCQARVDPLPRTLRCDITNYSGCPCLGSGSHFFLAWDPLNNWWLGSGSFCSCSVVIKLSCERLIADGLTRWHLFVNTNGAGFSEITGTPPAFGPNTCDPVHIQANVSYPGCCASTLSAVKFDIVEI